MRLPPLTRATLIHRYKRFLADVILPDGTQVTAHCPNTGSMKTCWREGAPVQLSHSDDPKRKLAWTLERVDMGAGWVGIHTGRTNTVIAEGIAAGAIPELAGYGALKREATVDLPGHPRSRLDLLLTEGDRPDAYVEVKNTTLYDEAAGGILFPDAVTTRGTKHLLALAALVKQGKRGVILYAVNRPEGAFFAPAATIDPVYAQTLKQVMNQGVEAIAVRIEHFEQGMRVVGRIPVRVE
ncbi:MAG: DNA/RNA nuclease SfsA [Alphaproteobacteria bacterium CG_4_10_14_0_2_um_filter_63_37]|nr:MAG: sugar fermentation stimulation protein SfsA [Proteobacteria bacterium CG1_02_64_396]PJA24326.1 MAG: DNA/RNA nuclease SfsA [Alphaproteobacteria bacterium CG_4_10_14_0_2_um_filter_63_37]